MFLSVSMAFVYISLPNDLRLQGVWEVIETKVEHGNQLIASVEAKNPFGIYFSFESQHITCIYCIGFGEPIVTRVPVIATSNTLAETHFLTGSAESLTQQTITPRLKDKLIAIFDRAAFWTENSLDSMVLSVQANRETSGVRTLRRFKLKRTVPLLSKKMIGLIEQ